MDKYSKNKDFIYKDDEFYYRINDDYYYSKWKHPLKVNLRKLINDFKQNFEKHDLFKVYLTGRFNSNHHYKTTDVDLKITYFNCKDKCYTDIYNCLFFLVNTGLTKYNILIDVCYVDVIHTIKQKCDNDSIVGKDFNEIIDQINDFEKKQGEYIIYYEKIEKVNKNLNEYINYEINKNVFKTIHINENTKLFIKKDGIVFPNEIKKKLDYIKNNTIYNDIYLL